MNSLKKYLGATAALALLGTGTASADNVINDDLIVTFSACVGNDCANGESFGFDTLRLKENNLRIHFDDTSNSASFPNNDWRITVNDSSNGGANKFSIDDVTGGRTPFTIEAGAPSNSLFVDDGGRVGLGTSTPVVDLHAVSGNTPTLRLEQDGSSGFTPQTWDLAGNEANFFVRDVTNGSRLPLQIKPGAPSNSIYVAASGDVGIGTTSPDAELDVDGGSETAILMLSQNGTVPTQWEFKNNAGSGRLTIGLNGGADPFKVDDGAVTNLFRVGFPDANTVEVNGNLNISAQCVEQDGACADFVFEPDYQRMSIADLKTFVTENKHLPDIPSAKEMQENGISVQKMQGRLLQKIEELVLYTIDQQETIEALNSRLEQVEKDG
ncbi:MAG: hypothetical protein QNJ29_08405 [Rhizobiaceae bacterium]|nr:hypothetical protein [Rhizobiaceae bacterium]